MISSILSKLSRINANLPCCQCTSSHDDLYILHIFRFSSDKAFAWLSFGVIHDKSSLLQEWLGAISQQAITSRYYPSKCWPRSLSPHGVTEQDELFSNARPSLLTYLRPKQNGRYFGDDMFNYIFLKEILISIKISLTLLPIIDHFQHCFM